MSLTAFNALDKPWIPVMRPDRRVEQVGIRRALVDAHEIVCVAEASPTVLVAIHRLLLAVLSRSTGDVATAVRADWFQTRLPGAAIDDYCAKWRDRFWLFHPERPFMQVPLLPADMEERVQDGKGEDRSKPAMSLALNAVAGNNVTLWGRDYDDAPSELAPGLALRLLVGHLAFQPMGLVRAFAYAAGDSALCNLAAVLPVGATLAKTLSLGLHPATAGDTVSWEVGIPGRDQLGKERVAFAGPNDRYTRLSRAVLLLPTETQSVRRMYYGVGISPRYDENNLDPMAAYRIRTVKGKSYRRGVSFEEGRAIWRDLPCLLPDPDGKHNEPPRVLEWARGVLDAAGAYDEPLDVMVAGVTARQSAMLRWRLETTHIAAEFEHDPASAGLLRDMTDRIEKAEFRFFKLAEQTVAAAIVRKPSRHTLADARAMLTASAARERFYQSIESDFHSIRAALAATKPMEEVTTMLNRALLKSYRLALDQLEGMLGSSPHALRAIGLKAREFRNLLATHE